MVTRANEEQGRYTEQLVAEEYGLLHTPDEAEWYDCRDPETGTKYEVKSTWKTLSDGSTGRYRLWESQHRSLLSANVQGTAWYVFVLLDSRGRTDAMRRAYPTSITPLVDSWNRAGHIQRDSRQYKLPWPDVHR